MDKHVLFTGRDIGAAHQLKHIIKAFKGKEFIVSIIASGVAYETFAKENLNPFLFSIRGNLPYLDNDAPDNMINELVATAYKVINETNPDAVFCGLTTFGYGIDEAALYWASEKRLNIPSFQFLDTWGTFNHFRDGYPDLYFAIDRASVRLGIMGAKAPIEVVGSPKHFAYSTLDINALRKKTRKELNLSDDEKMIGYFGQDPTAPGQTYNFAKFIEAVKFYILKGGKCKFLFRMHPAYTNRYEYFWRYLKETGIEVIGTTNGLPVEEILCACDLIVTCFSTTGIDHAFLSRFAKEPIGVVLYLLCGNEIKNYMMRSFGYWKVPILEDGIGYYAEHENQLSDLINYVLDNPSATTNYFEATKALIAHDPSEKIVEVISSFIK